MHPCADPLQPPNDVHLSQVSIPPFQQWDPVHSVCADTQSDVGFTRLTFCWSPVSSAIYRTINYVIMATEGCGVCPRSTSDPCVTCVNNNQAINATCDFSVQSVVCENITGNFSSPVTFQLQVGGMNIRK